MKSTSYDAFLGMGLIILYILIVIGYLMNWVKILSAAFGGADFTFLVLVRLICALIFWPVAAIMGYF